jgi:hypothetical protein
MTAKRKPCPFCGANGDWLAVMNMSDDDGDNGRLIWCGRCHTHGPRFVPSERTMKPTDRAIDTKAGAWKAWNERAK